MCRQFDSGPVHEGGVSSSTFFFFLAWLRGFWVAVPPINFEYDVATLHCRDTLGVHHLIYTRRLVNVRGILCLSPREAVAHVFLANYSRFAYCFRRLDALRRLLIFPLSVRTLRCLRFCITGVNSGFLYSPETTSRAPYSTA